jgi:hypothetical protein
MDTNVTRRSALRTTALASMAAALLGHSTHATTAAAAAPAPVTLATVVNADDLAAESLHRAAQLDEATAAMWSRLAALDLTDDQRRAVGLWFDDEVGHQMVAYTDLMAGELIRHMPGLAPALALIWEHVQEERTDAYGRCCQS